MRVRKLFPPEYSIPWKAVIPAAAVAVIVSAQPAWAGAAADTFGAGGPGLALVQLLLLAAFGTLLSYVVSALGHGQIASMVKLLTVFGCISLVINVVWSTIATIASVFGVQL
ncbi:MAG: hypothetical protein U1D96_03470 [Eubacteriales bacterium]|nr:hypothetical protein [Eubacteriales bacterium]